MIITGRALDFSQRRSILMFDCPLFQAHGVNYFVALVCFSFACILVAIGCRHLRLASVCGTL